MARDEFDVAIVGGGLAGSALAAVLARRGVDVRLFDLHENYPPDFRAEKLTLRQTAALHRLGLAEPVLAAATSVDELWIARFGRVVERRPNREYGIDYAVLVNALRNLVPQACRRKARVARIDATADRQTLHFGGGTTVRARLVVVASGLGRALLQDLGIGRLDVPGAALAIGFDMTFAAGGPHRTPLTYYGEAVRDRSAYLTVFPIAGRARANLFVYRDHGEPWCRAFRAQPRACLLATLPGLDAVLGDFAVTGTPVLRPISLYESAGHMRDGAVLIGDAFSTACPTGGTGIDKVLTDVEQLAGLVPRWLATEGMGREKIAQFYNDRIKRACDKAASASSRYARGMAVGDSPAWAARRRRNFYGQRLRYWLRRRIGRHRPDSVESG